MSLEFDYQKLGSISDVKGGKRLPKRHSLINIPNSHPYIKVKDMAPDKLLKLTDNFEYIENETFNEISQYIVNKGDLIISIVGTIGLTNIIEYSLDNANLTENCAKITNLKKGYNVDYIYYFLNSKIGQNLIQESTVGAVQKKLPIKNIRDLNIPFPDFDIQNKIVDLLSTIDKKIENCKSINKNLEALAKSIYRYHFIDFEPYSQDNFKSTTIGEIPENWEVQSIGDFVDDMKNGGTPKRGESDYWDDGTVPWLKTGEINNNMIIKSEEYITELGLKNSSAKLLPINSIIMALYGKGTAARVGLLKLKATTNQACCAMICNDFNKTLFLYLFLLFNQKEIENLASGSVQQNLSKDLIANLELVVPPIEIIENLPFKEIYDKIANNYFEIEYLTNLRDTLLPKLMSGEIDVSKINCDLK